MKIQIRHYSEVTKDELYDLLSLRVEVFVIEQNCPYQDLDGLDKDAFHLIVVDEGKIIGTLRILKSGIVYPEVAIGRVVSHPGHRDKQLGYLMMQKAMQFIEEELNEESIRLSAQTHLCQFYEKCGFSSTGKEYLEDGIPHTEMLYSLIQPK
ncbi:MAG: GNAT family N-acetyltransferase [Crocinitomicaceae bacterium]